MGANVVALWQAVASPFGMRFLRRQLWLRLAFSGGLVVLLLLRIDIGQAGRALLEAHYVYVVPALAFYTLSKLVDTYRWRLMLARLGEASLSGLFGTFLIANMANNFVPVRIGDVLRVQLPAQRYGLPRAGVTATVFVTETLLDGVTFVILALVGLALLDIPSPLTNLIWSLLAVVVVGLALAAWGARFRLPQGWQRRGWWRWLPPPIHRTVNELLPPFVEGLAALRDLRLGGRLLALSLVAWLLEVGMYWLFGIAFDMHIPIASYLLIMIAANMIVAMPLAPSNLGPYEVAVAEVAIALGVARPLAGGFAIGAHLITILWMTISGLVAMWLMNLSIEEIFRLHRRVVSRPSGPDLARS